jgi:acetyl esterase/lipase
MAILDPSRIGRPEIREILELLDRLRNEARDEFLRVPQNREIDLGALWARVMEANRRWFDGEDMSGCISAEEQRFLARLHRFSVDYRADWMQANHPMGDGVHLEPADAGGVPGEWQTVPETDESRVLLYFHGGGYIMGSPNFTRLLTVQLGRVTGSRVLSIDYRLAPEHPYPMGLDDCCAAYRWLLEEGFDSRKIVVAGDSAGGYFTLMTLLRIRDEGLAPPACAVGLCPATDLALTGPTYITNGPTDPVLADLGIFWWLEAHLAGADPHDPAVSPLYADLANLPPILIQASASEMLLDDARFFHEKARKAGADVTLQTWEDTIHVFHQYELPESQEAFSEIKNFVDRHTG